jgi:pimeloyl-ACP methyl ester carboxylesterase
VLLIHGISTEGTWIPESTRFLEPFFRVVPVKFNEYRKWGALKVLFDPLWFGVTLSVMLAIWIFYPHRALFLPFFLLVGLLVARLRAVARLNQVMKKFVVALHEGAGRTGGLPNIIGHSLGTYVAGRVFQRHPSVRYGRVILYGCVLRRDFSWDKTASHVHARFTVRQIIGVWNEVSLEDWVPAIAESLGPRLGLGFGGAGRYGFSGPGVHSRAHDSPCSSCVDGALAKVHNVSSKLSHSDAFYGAGHCRQVWLPFLLGYDPAEYLCLMQLCELLYQSSHVDRFAASLYDAELAEIDWDWCGGQLSARTVDMIKKESLGYTEAQLWDLADRVRAEFWSTIALAQLTQGGVRTSTLDSDDLDPKIVLQNCTDRVLASYG